MKHSLNPKPGVSVLWIGAAAFLLLLGTGLLRSIVVDHSIPRVAVEYSSAIRAAIDRHGIEAAIPWMRTAMIIDFDNVQASSELLDAARIAGDLPSQLTALQSLVRLKPQDPQIRNDLVSALLTEGRVWEAFDHAQAAVRLSPRSSTAYCNCGAALLGMGRNREAAEYYREALKLDPNSQAARLALEYPLRGF